jgi:beta-lactamase regulating signal transducer with metallopeptidase domain
MTSPSFSALADFAIHASLLLIAALVLSGWLLVRCSAALRYSLLVAVVLCLPALPLFSLYTPSWAVTHAESLQPLKAIKWTTTLQVGEPVAVPTSTQPQALPARQTTLSIDVLLAGVWAVGAVLGLLGLLLSMRQLARARAASVAFTHPRSEGVEVRLSASQSMPMTWGLWRPIILLPDCAQSWPETRLSLVLAHELAHVARRDAFTHLASSIVARLLWWNPLVWLAVHQLATLRELACDDHVIAQGFEPEGYAEGLIEAISSLQQSECLPGTVLGLGMASSSSEQLRQRLDSILDESTDRSATTVTHTWSIAATVLLATGLVSGLAACREQAQTSAGSSTVAATSDGVPRVYYLTQVQKDWLMSEANPAHVVSDPFGAAKATSVSAVDIRTRLLSLGIQFLPNEKDEAVAMIDDFAIKLWADEENHKKVATLLGTLPIDQRMFQIRSVAVEIPTNSETLDLILPKKADGGLSMEALLDSDRGNELLKKLSSTPGVTIVGSPMVAARSGQKAHVDITREFYYPTEFDPPSLSDDKSKPVLPTTPTTFEMKPLGIRFEFKPVYQTATSSIELTLTPELNEFEGFNNFGTPILGPDSTVLSENRIVQPIFRTHKMTTSVIMKPGQYLVLGGPSHPDMLDHSKDVVDPKKSTSITDQAKLPPANWRESKTSLYFFIQVTIGDPPSAK